jgi:hypothetical protein
LGGDDPTFVGVDRDPDEGTRTRSLDSGRRISVDAATTSKFTSSASGEWETAPAVFRKLDQDFGPFTVDLCAREGNAKCPIWLGPGSLFGEDAVGCLWDEWITPDAVGFCNPPYGRFISRILPHAFGLGIMFNVRSVFLLPLRITHVFQRYAITGGADIYLCTRRLIFWEAGAPRLNPTTGKPDVALFDSCVVVYGGTTSGRVRLWEPPTTKAMAQPCP